MAEIGRNRKLADFSKSISIADVQILKESMMPKSLLKVLEQVNG